MCVLLFLKKDLTDPPELILASSGDHLLVGHQLLNIVHGRLRSIDKQKLHSAKTGSARS